MRRERAIDAQDGDDSVTGTKFNDLVNAGNGNDIVNGGRGGDLLFGGNLPRLVGLPQQLRPDNRRE